MALVKIINEENVATAVGALDQEEWQFVSQCSTEQHSLQRVGRWTTDATLSWCGRKGFSERFGLPTAPSNNTKWVVNFYRYSDDDFVVGLYCDSLDEQFSAADVRLVAVVEGAPDVWVELADVLQRNKKVEWWLSCVFCKKVSECPKVIPIKVRVTVQWTELEHLTPTSDLWMDSAVCIRCSWQLSGWNVIPRTADGWWSLWSESFGRSSVLWRIQVVNMHQLHARIGGKRELRVAVWLQHLPISVEWSRVSWKCSLTAWSRQFDERQKNMERDLCCVWTVLEDVDVGTQDPLDLVVVIQVSRKK